MSTYRFSAPLRCEKSQLKKKVPRKSLVASELIEDGLRCPEHPELFLSASMYFLQKLLYNRINDDFTNKQVKENVRIPNIALSMNALDHQPKLKIKVEKTQSLPISNTLDTNSCLLFSKYLSVARIPFKEFITLKGIDKYTDLLDQESTKPKRKLKQKQILPVAKKEKTTKRWSSNPFRRQKFKPENQIKCDIDKETSSFKEIGSQIGEVVEESSSAKNFLNDSAKNIEDIYLGNQFSEIKSESGLISNMEKMDTSLKKGGEIYDVRFRRSRDDNVALSSVAPQKKPICKWKIIIRTKQQSTKL